MSGLSRYGLTLTAIWVILIGFYLSRVAGGGDFLGLGPNEVGDFLAGFFAPIALLWIIIGYFQQGKELHLQRSELELQRKELQLQREETHRLADEAQRQAKAIEANELHARRDTFLRVYELSATELNLIATHLLRRISPSMSISEMLWGRFQRGEKDAILKEVAGYFQPERREATIAKLDNVMDRSEIARFCNIYERLRAQAANCDPDGHLKEHFENSAMGRLYAVVKDFQ